MIAHGYQQNLTLDPGTFSVDPDDIIFKAIVSYPIHRHTLNASPLTDRTGAISTTAVFMASKTFRTSMDRC